MRDYEELVKVLRENAEWADENIWEVPIMLPDNLRQAADAIEELIKPKWISVEERLPDFMHLVLVCTKFDNIYIAWHLGNNDWRSCEGNIQNITHWMPLPNLPERN